MVDVNSVVEMVFAYNMRLFVVTRNNMTRKVNGTRRGPDGGRVPVDGEAPELNAVQNSITDIYRMCTVSPVVGHGALLERDESDESGTLVVCKHKYIHTDLDGIKRYIEQMPDISLK
ncbi:uncharacterized protein FMAN_15460 [Fusarium mangiferae]|uniref:Uncharacterized protein n=1 Tax=Fusarium mangiferae TaxID=192010 RepID=A0A1L7UNW9_FUSMA|nr:uncharacterized protein FMAN_15460 [Fusarium mangiferae]CVL09221.1 uncharacterized protein FMAN_15460 [Fusarium mangiferae]